MEHGVYIDEVSHKFGGNQCMIINHGTDNEVLIPFTYSQGHCILETKLPTEAEMSDLPIYEITSDKPWHPKKLDDIEFDISKLNQERCTKRMKLHKGMFTRKSLTRWGKLLYCSDLAIVKRTLKATTQLAMVEPTISQAPLKQHAKRRFFSLQHCRIRDEVFTNTIIIKRGKLSIHGFKYAQLYVCSKSRMTKVYSMKSKDQALNSLLQFFTDVGIPDKIVYDGAREFSSQAWRQELA